ncbi:hypothetical protein [Bacillus thuringiensis]|uniref:hypothetical protein n=1 Tax=Bacillus thuringiensis TaxID=1428 RepID=UPI0039B6D07D
MKEPKHHPTFALDIDNLETICVDYHNKKHGRTLKKKHCLFIFSLHKKSYR